MKWVFDELLRGIFNTEQVWKQAKGLKCSKNNFWMAIRNPVYCGKIFIPKHKEEENHFVQGSHEPLISEKLYYQVQEVLEGRKRKLFAHKVVEMEELPLRGFLKCPKSDCGRMLTGSASKGRSKYYHYYHCSSSCGCRFHADVVNSAFLTELRKYVPKKQFVPLYKITLFHAYNELTGFRQGERKIIMDELDKINLRLKNARKMRADKEIDLDDFRKLKQECEERPNELEIKLINNSVKEKGIDDLINQAVDKLLLLEEAYNNGRNEEQRSIIGSIFTEKWVFDGKQHRTNKVNEVVECIYFINKELEGKKNGTSANLSHLSQEVTPLGLEPRTY
jgi:site-specific DNA recombinase